MTKTISLKTLFFISLFCFSGSFLFSQECNNGVSLYQKTYGGTKDDFGYNVISTSDSGFVIVGQTNSFGSGGFDGLIQKVSKQGNVVWSKALGGSGHDVLHTIKRTSDNGFIAVGQTKSFGNTAGDGWLVKLDALGNVQWSKKYGDGNLNGEMAYDVVQLSDGGYAFCGSHRFVPGSAEGFVVRTDSQGNVTWAKQYGRPGSDQLISIIEDGNSLVVVGFFQGGSFYDSYIMKLDKSDGTIQWTKAYDGENRSTWFSRIAKTNNGYQVMALITNDFVDTQQQESVWNIDVNGNLQNVRKLVIPGTHTISYGWLALADGGFIAANGENNNGSDIILCRVNANGNIVWSKKYQRAGRQVVYSIQASTESGYVLAGVNNNAGIATDSSNVYLMKVDSVGNAGTCSGINTTDVTISAVSFISPSFAFTQATVTIQNPVITVNSVAFVAAATTLCSDCLSSPPDVPLVEATANTICAGSNTILIITGGLLNGATSWKWYTGSCGGTLVGSGFAISVSPTVTTTYYVRGEGGSSGPGNCGSITITVNNQTTPAFTSIPPLCQDSVAPVLPTTSNNGVTGSWSPAIINTGNPGLAYYTFTPDSNQCASSLIMSIIIIPPTTPEFTQIGPLCQNSTAPVLPTVSNNGITGTWSPATINTSIAGTRTYAFTPGTGQCAGATTIDIAIVNNQPQITYCPPPVILCYDSSDEYSIPQLITTDVCGNVSISFSITGATIRTGTGNNASGVFNQGNSAILWTVIDLQGDTTNCVTTVTINKVLAEIPDVKALNYSGIAYNTVYPDYAPASSITLTVTGGNGSYSYNWSTGQTTQSIAVSPLSTTLYTVTVTDTSGCQAVLSKEIIVKNISCGGHKVYMCHITGNPDHVVEICIDDNAVPAHLAAGCSLGECPASRTISSVVETEVVEFTVQVVPNPSQTHFKLILNHRENTPVSLKIMDVLGRVIETRLNITATSNLIFGNNLRPGAYLAEIIQGANRRVIKLIKM